jgi:hypothetical protein
MSECRIQPGKPVSGLAGIRKKGGKLLPALGFFELIRKARSGTLSSPSSLV